ncbi:MULTISPECIES: flagellar hook-length control protein FliK [unclassified Sinorhizobium]|uniref:flagellar hook-length control protein FliK n=1 Tax=unclassified Sinorhizobium TaxID=2613772 RepID=UPI0024C3B417|nr:MULTISPECIES: flagellar hook-length control protein FliK [unclassified Sinorhizobium]MDK1378015.1 flagellar hook-length control protein FliK [Sinorhizobium sp. 6-70]MDK1478345.1 flagellar hook-length control protein FliK [Sinorhizobium sp. 6-117]
MRPLEESLRGPTPAPTGKAASRHGGREESGQASGAFEDAIADAGRQKAPGRGPATSDAKQQTDNPPEIGSQAPTDNVTAADGRKIRASIGRNGLDGSWDAETLHDLGNGGAEDKNAAANRSTSDARSVREQAMKRLQRMGLANKERTPSGRDPGGEQDMNALAQKMAALAREQARAGAAATPEARAGAEQEDAFGTTEPAKGTVDDLLTMLGAAAVITAALQQPEGEGRVSGDRTVPGNAARIKAGEGLADLTPDDGLHGESDVSESDQLFRFARADGKGQAVSMAISRDGEKAVVDNAKPATTAKAENVTVLEARRYLGLAMNPNAASVTGAIAGDSGWAQLMQSSTALAQADASSQVGKTLNTLKIQMHPIELGTVTATLRLKDDELQVDLKVESGEAFRQLRDDQGEMVKALRAQGFAVDQVNIVFNAGGDASSGGNAQQQAQTAPGQQGREHAGEGSGQERQRQDGAQAAATERWAGNDGLDDAPADAERNRAGYVYM